MRKITEKDLIKMESFEPKDKDKINKICLGLKKTLKLISKSKLFKKQPRLFSVYGELKVIYELLKRGHRIVRKGNPKVDLELTDIHKTIEIKTSSLKNNRYFGSHYDSSQKGKFDYLTLVGFDEFNKDKFYIFTKKEAEKFDKGYYVGRPGYFVNIYTMGIPAKRRLSKSMKYINRNIKSFENRWDKIK